MIRYCLLLFSLLLVDGCILQQKHYSRATIVDSSEWKLVKRCGSGACRPSNDHILSKNIEIRVDALNYEPNYIDRGIFLIRVMFPGGEIKKIEFDPSQPTVQLRNSNLQAKGFLCAGTTMIDRSFLKSVQPVTSYQAITESRYCFYLSFEASPPSVHEVFSLNLSGVRRNGDPVDVPKIVFRPGKG